MNNFPILNYCHHGVWGARTHDNTLRIQLILHSIACAVARAPAHLNEKKYQTEWIDIKHIQSLIQTHTQTQELDFVSGFLSSALLYQPYKLFVM